MCKMNAMGNVFMAILEGWGQLAWAPNLLGPKIELGPIKFGATVKVYGIKGPM